MKNGMKIGEIFTVERDVSASTGTNYLLVRLEGSIALVETYLLRGESPLPDGGTAKKVFMFKCIRSGEAAIQFGEFRASAPSHIIYEQVFPIQVDEDSVDIDGDSFGGWTEFRELSETDKELFKKVMRGIVGVGYEPLQVSTQVVQGINYRFNCKATSATNPPEHYLAQITIFAPLPDHGEPYVKNIERIPENEG